MRKDSLQKLINNNLPGQKDSGLDYDMSSWEFSDNWSTVSQIEQEIKALKTASPGGAPGGASNIDRPSSASSNIGKGGSTSFLKRNDEAITLRNPINTRD